MPVFDFRCQDCGHRFEDLVRWQDVEEGKVRCPQCGSRRVERLLSLFAVAGKRESDSSPCSPFC